MRCVIEIPCGKDLDIPKSKFLKACAQWYDDKNVGKGFGYYLQHTKQLKEQFFERLYHGIASDTGSSLRRAYLKCYTSTYRSFHLFVTLNSLLGRVTGRPKGNKIFKEDLRPYMEKMTELYNIALDTIFGLTEEEEKWVKPFVFYPSENTYCLSRDIPAFITQYVNDRPSLSEAEKQVILQDSLLMKHLCTYVRELSPVTQVKQEKKSYTRSFYKKTVNRVIDTLFERTNDLKKWRI